MVPDKVRQVSQRVFVYSKKLRSKIRLKRILLTVFAVLAVGGTAVTSLVVFANNRIERSCRTRCYSDVSVIPYRKVGLVLGTAPKIGHRENLYFSTRIKAAAELYHAKKVSFLLVSGDNGTHYYNEVDAMKAALIKQGVPAEKIFKDHAGFRTLDSMIRAKEVFLENSVTVISQPFHNARALYIGDHHGLRNSIAFNAENVNGYWAKYTLKREKLARFKALLDVKVFHLGPKFLGPSIPIKEVGVQ